ncbi:hypothetical protein BKM35_21965 [Salmonella enterica]|nr:hypothetical protein [Salmonella enterica]
MKIMTEKDITGGVARELRLKLGMTQDEFWGPIYRQRKQASDYERTFTDKQLPDVVRMIIFIRYYLGFDYDISSPEGVQKAQDAMKRIKGPGYKSLEKEVERQQMEHEETRQEVAAFIEDQIFQLLELKKGLQSPVAPSEAKHARRNGRSEPASGNENNAGGTGDQTSSER